MQHKSHIAGGDIAEIYWPDAKYEPGTVVIFGGTCEITQCHVYCDYRVAGVISEGPAFVLNSTAEGIPVSLRGRVKARVMGAVRKGDLLVTSWTPGHFVSVKNDMGIGAAVAAKSLVDSTDSGSKLIEVVLV